MRFKFLFTWSLLILFFGNTSVSSSELYCGVEQSTDFEFSSDVGFGDTYEKNPIHGYKLHGACVVTKGGGHPVRLGNQSIKFEVRPGDCGYGSGWSDCEKDRARHELIGKRREDGEYWYNWSVYLPLDFQNVYPINLTIGQFHQDHPDYSAEVAWNFRNKAGGYHLYGTGKYTVRLIDDDAGLKGRWNDVTVNAKWTHHKDGFLRVWINGEPSHHYEGPTKTNGPRIFHRFGIYQTWLSRFKAEYPDAELPTQVVYFDEIRTASTCAALKMQDLGYSCPTLLQSIKKLPVKRMKPTYDRTEQGLRKRFDCFIESAKTSSLDNLPSAEVVDAIIGGLKGNKHYRTKRHLLKLGVSETTLDKHKSNLLRLVNFEGTNEAFCAKPLR